MEEMTGKTLNSELLLAAYSQGYFPMPDPESGEILWFRPNPRAIIPLEGFHLSRSSLRKIKQKRFNYTVDQDFRGVMLACTEGRDNWINNEFLEAYGELNQLGFAHSLEVWAEGKLVGGTYGVCLGGAFFAESKFHRVTDASKIALHYLVKHMQISGLSLLECQFITPHLASLGAIEISDQDYITQLNEALERPVKFSKSTII